MKFLFKTGKGCGVQGSTRQLLFSFPNWRCDLGIGIVIDSQPKNEAYRSGG